MQAEKTLKTVSPTKKLKARVQAVKDKLPEGYRAIIIQHYDEYNTVKGYQLISNVIALRTANEPLTEILEKIADGKLTLKAP